MAGRRDPGRRDRRPSWTGFPLAAAPWWLNALFVIVLGALTPLLALRFRCAVAIAAGLGALAAFVIAAQLAFERGTIFAVFYPIVAAVAGAAGRAARSTA